MKCRQLMQTVLASITCHNTTVECIETFSGERLCPAPCSHNSRSLLIPKGHTLAFSVSDLSRVLPDPIIEALDDTGAELPDRVAYEKDYKVC